MHPVLIQLKIPASWTQHFGPATALYGRWQLLLVFFVIGVVMAMWASGPEQSKDRRWMIWVGALVALATGLPLAGIGLVRLGEIKLHTYGVMISTAFLVGIALAVREARRSGEDPEHILDFSFWVLIAAIIGSRVLYILTTWHEYENDLGKLFRPWEGGLVFFGGLLGSILCAIWFVRKHDISFWKLADICIPSVALGQFFGRIGCFSAGCCHGKVTTAEWGVKFTTGLAPKGVLLYPTQLFEASGNLTIFFLLLAIRSRKRYDGQALVWYLFLYPIVRFIVELYRGDVSRGFLFKLDIIKHIPGPDLLTTSQIISLGLFGVGVASMLWLNRQNSRKPLGA